MPVLAERSVDARIASSTTPGFPITTRWSLRAAGVHRKAVSRRVADGRLAELWTDTFVLGVDPRQAPRELITAAAVAAAGPCSALDSVSALERRGVWDRHEGPIHVVSTRWHDPIPPWPVKFHRAASASELDASLVDQIPTRRTLRALLAAAPLLTPHQLAYVIGEAEYRRELRLEEVFEALSSCRLRGMPALRRALELRRAGSAGTKSKTEDRLLPLLTAAFGEPLVNVRGAAGLPDYEPDTCWQERRCIVEVDGDQHTDDPAEIARDAARDRILRAAGWTIVRIHWRRVWQDQVAVLAEIRAAFEPT